MGPFIPFDHDEQNEPPIPCIFCGFKYSWSNHHLIPRTTWLEVNPFPELVNRKHETIRVCRTCHKKIHQLIPNRQLAFNYNTVETLKEHPLFAQYLKQRLEWAAKTEQERLYEHRYDQS